MNRVILNAFRTLNVNIVTLPVVVHIINQAPNSITDPQVISGINDLNDAFGKTGNYAGSAGVDTKIRFCLAKKDPDGGNTTGITRTTSYFSNDFNLDIEDARLKNLVQWDPSRYINIWLITNIRGESYANFSCGVWYRLGVGGYATLPPNGSSLDGIVVTGFGAVLAHEMGHYLGLYHTFDGGCSNTDCLTQGDRVCDTPPDGSVSPSPSCGNPQNSCFTDTLSNYSNGNFFTDVPDQVTNFMDYGNPACSNQFTQGQADRMHAAINTQRSGLLQDECTQPCIQNITAGFTRNVAYPVPGDVISFTNTTTGVTNYEWLVNDTVRATTANFVYTFNSVGKNKVTLKAFNTVGCFASYTDYVLVNCGVTARFFTDKKAIFSKFNVYSDSIIFANNSYNAQSYQWLISNDQGMAEQVVSTAVNLTYVFPTPANYSIRLVATNGGCSDTTEMYMVPVLDPTPDGAPYNITIACFQQTNVRVNFCIADYGFAALPKNTPINFYDADPLQPGAHKLSPTFYLPIDVPGGNCAFCFTHTLNVPYQNLNKIFLVFNDNGSAIPVLLPNGSLPEKNYLNNIQSSQINKTVVTTEICEGQNYAGHTSTGTFVDVYTAANGCDSTRTLNLTVHPLQFATIATSICQGENYAGHTKSGTYKDVYNDIYGCDSTRTLHLMVKPVFSTNVAATICDGFNYAGHTTTGTYVDVYTPVNGCDSTRTLKLTVHPNKFTVVDTAICDGETYLAGGHLQTTTGIYVDTLSTYLDCDSIVTTNLIVHPLPTPDLGQDRGVCIGDVLILDPGNFTTYLWQDGSTQPKFTTNLIGDYSVTVTDTFGCKNDEAMRLTEIYPLPANFLIADSSLCKGNILQVKLPGYINYMWSTGSTDDHIGITNAGTYNVQVTDAYGCVGIDSMKVFFYDNCITIQIPNAFTPNGDGKNDEFKPLIPVPVNNYHMQIWNRWGRLLFETRERLKGWDGTFKSVPQAPAAYVYLITFKDLDGVNIKKYSTMILVR
ncbi:MAG: M43 family zinc metalloprotease [Ferruginibacter sp.]